MKWTKSTRITNASLRAIKEKMGHRDTDEPLHASDIYQCERRTVASRVHGEPQLSKEEIEIMFPGFAIQEYAWGEEAPGVKWPPKEEGKDWYAIFSVDGEVPDAVLEMKTTGAWVKYLEAPKEQWLDRTKSYCVVKGVSEAFITVFSFSSRKFVEWEVEFTDKELAEEEAWLREKIPHLTDLIKRGDLPPVTTRRYEWECKYCPFYTHEDVNCKPLLKDAGMKKG